MPAYPPAPITCHVLNTVSGQPAPGITVKLELNRASLGELPQDSALIHDMSWTSVTNANGRVTEWNHPNLPLDVAFISLFDNQKSHSVDYRWTLTFIDVGNYFRGESWWTDIPIHFKTELEVAKGDVARTHWHVPLLLSPYSYSTYRGS